MVPRYHLEVNLCIKYDSAESLHLSCLHIAHSVSMIHELPGDKCHTRFGWWMVHAEINYNPAFRSIPSLARLAGCDAN